MRRTHQFDLGADFERRLRAAVASGDIFARIVLDDVLRVVVEEATDCAGSKQGAAELVNLPRHALSREADRLDVAARASVPQRRTNHPRARDLNLAIQSNQAAAEAAREQRR